jgi:hypothetical protein
MNISVGVWAYDMYIPRHRHGYGMTWPMDKHREKENARRFTWKDLWFIAHMSCTYLDMLLSCDTHEVH